jgi:hypothetical protein
MEKVFKVAVVFAATTVDVPFTEVTITIAENATIDALREKLQKVKKFAIPEEGLGRVKLRLAACNPIEEFETLGETIDLKELIDLKLGMRLNHSLAEHELIKDKPFAAQYAGGLPNNARIVVVLPAPSTPANAAGGAGPGGGSLRRWTDAELSAASTGYTRALWDRPLPELAATPDDFRFMIDADLLPIRAMPEDYPIGNADVASILPLEQCQAGKAPMREWSDYIRQEVLSTRLHPRVVDSEITLLGKFKGLLSGAWGRAAADLGLAMCDYSNSSRSAQSTPRSPDDGDYKLDHSVVLGEVLVVAGEHKVPANAAAVNPARDDLVVKFSSLWNGIIMHGLPYLPAYTVCGN